MTNHRDEMDSLVARMRAGDPEAATEFLQLYGDAIRRCIRKQLNRSDLRRHLDSTDILQSVLRGLWVAVRGEKFDIDRDEDLVNFIVACAKNKIRDKQRHYRAESAQRTNSGSALAAFVAVEPGPSDVVSMNETLAKVRHLLTEEEWRLALAHVNGRSWVDLARERDETTDSVRKRVMRAIELAREKLGAAADAPVECPYPLEPAT